MSGAIVHGKDIDRTELTPDVCIVGSGAGGAVTAAQLTQRGLSVVVLEEGGYYTAKDFELHEPQAYSKLYQEGGLRTTADTAIGVLQGRTVGGTTTVNWTSSFRTPNRIIEHWKSVHGVHTLSSDVLRPHFEAVEKRLNIHPWPIERQNRNNSMLWRAAGKLGWSRGQIRRNVLRCMDTGYCGFGCPVDAKQAMHLTYLPDAVAKGALVYANTRVDRLEHSGTKVTAVHASVLDAGTGEPTGVSVTVRAKLTVVSGGAINTPLLLQRSELNANGRTGRRTYFHPVTALFGVYNERIAAFRGAPQSAFSHQFSERTGQLGFFIEAGPIFPMLTAAAVGGLGAEHQATMQALPNTGLLAALLIDGLLPGEEGGTVTARKDGRPHIDYPLTDLHMEAFRTAMKACAALHFAAGAREVKTLHRSPLTLRSKADIDRLDDAPWAPLQFPIFTFHQMGGACMGVNPELSVVDPKLKFHGLDNLYIVDGSVLPTALGVNPSETIYGLAHWAAEHIAASV